MKLIKALPIFVSWIIALILIADYAHIVICISVFLLFAAPFSKLILEEYETDVLPPSSLDKFSALTNMTCLGIVKAGIISGKAPKKRPDKILNLSNK